VAVYTRTQLWLLLGLVVLAGAGILVTHWRRTHVELAARIERFDTGDSPSAPEALPGAPASRADEGQRRPRAGLTGPAPDSREHRAADQPPGKRGASAHGSPRGQAPAGPHPLDRALDLNHASIDDLVRLPGVGPALAERIVAARAGDGPFASVDDLARVPGIGPAKLARLRDLVSVSPGGPPR
jgi:competence ComEA-like helix-hairpin-helix protein